MGAAGERRLGEGPVPHLSASGPVRLALHRAPSPAFDLPPPLNTTHLYGTKGPWMRI